MVHPALAGRLESGGDLTGDPADLVTRDATVGDELGERIASPEVLLDDVGDVVVGPDVEMRTKSPW